MYGILPSTAALEGCLSWTAALEGYSMLLLSAISDSNHAKLAIRNVFIRSSLLPRP